jgi:uncharacterized protein YdhG (YjbR/CyaY superfamily)
MAKSEPRNVDAYLEEQPERTRAVLEKVRAAIQRALPHADEVISYKMAAYKVNGKIALYVAGWKEHYSIYPAGDTVLQALKKELSNYEVQRGTIRFPLDQPVPVKLIERIAAMRAEEVRDRAKRNRRVR